MDATKLEQTAVNDPGTNRGADTPVTRGRSGPVPAEVIDKDRRVLGSFCSMAEAYTWAEAKLGSANQDSSPNGEDPNGWDVQIAGAK